MVLLDLDLGPRGGSGLPLIRPLMATVRSQIHSLLQKLGVHSQIGAVAAARQGGWAPDTD